jgi:hypothetical protein
VLNGGRRRQRGSPLFQLVLVGYDRPEFVADPSRLLLQLFELFLQRPDLALVRPAQDISAAIVEPMAVVFLVAATPTLDLAGPGQRSALPPETLVVVAADVVEPAVELSLDPLVERRVVLDLQLRRQGLGGWHLGRSSGVGADPVVDEACPEVGVVDPSSDPGVVLVGHQ